VGLRDEIEAPCAARASGVGPLGQSAIIDPSMAHPPPQIGEVVAERYEIQSVLGRGGMGVVFAARHTISGRRVALKWMEPEPQDEPGAKERFLREARAMGRIEHGNVVGVLDVGTVGEAAYLVMELLRGESLRAVIEREAPMPIERAIALLLPAMEGVEAAHRAGVVHRDLKPENLFVAKLTDGGTVTKVLDFGISKLDESARSGTRSPQNLTKTGHVVGTPQYMSPEQVRGAAVDARTDVWALGTILYEMLTARTPFEAENFGGLLVAIATEAFTPLYQRMDAPPPALVVAVHRALEKEQASRHASVLAFARALEPLAKGLTFREPSRASLVPAAASPFAATASTPSSLELEDVKRPTSTPTTPSKPAPAKPAPSKVTLPATVSARKSPARGSAARPVLEGLAQDDEVELPRRGPSRTMLAIAAGIVCVVLAGAAFAFSGGETPTPPPPVLAPPPVVTEAIPSPPTPPVTPIVEPVVAADPVAAPVTAPEPDHHRTGHARTPTVTVPVPDAVPEVVVLPTPPSTTTRTPPSRSGSISRDDF
jgi:serine/threonine protein kinase